MDVIIIGGGVMGCSVAYHLALLSEGRSSILVVEPDPGYRTASSALSLSSIRQQFSTPANIAMSRYGLEFIRSAGSRLSTDHQDIDLGFVERPYLFLAGAEEAAALHTNFLIQRDQHVPVELLDRPGLAHRFSWLNTADLALGVVSTRDEGWFDGYSLLMGLRRKARALGATFVDDRVVELNVEGLRVASVTLASGAKVRCDHVVNAAGPRAGEIARLAGIDLPVRPQKRCVFVVDCPGAPPGLPLVIDPSGVYVRPEGRTFLAGAPRPEGYADDYELDVDYALFDDIVWPALAARVPAFETLKLVGAWAGHYEMNTKDGNAILGAAAARPNFWMINGFSGHGLQQAPAAGRGIAELVLFGNYRTLDLSPFDVSRLSGATLGEQNIV